jgi:hypothetical protein
MLMLSGKLRNGRQGKMSLRKFLACPGCSNSDEGGHIYECSGCGYIGCTNCWPDADCPECDKTAYYAKLRELIGEIVAEDDM